MPGRFELVSGSFPVHVVVDYAHTPEGIHQAITVAREIAPGRVIAVFGAGGDRDREKRPLMGRAAIEADLSVLTSDNPRSEDPEADHPRRRVGNRGIRAWWSSPIGGAPSSTPSGAASPGDVVLILGKGHETGQEIGERILPFDDQVVAR